MGKKSTQYPYNGSNCQYCGMWNCKPSEPVCDEQKAGRPADHPARKFKAGDWVRHDAYGVGQVAFVQPIDKGVRVTFNDNRPTDWYVPSELTIINSEVFPARDMNGTLLAIGNTVYYPTPKGGDGNGACIRKGIVVNIEDEATHRGYGYYTRKMRIKPDGGGKIFVHNYPGNCLKVN